MTTTVFCKFFELCDVDTLILTHTLYLTVPELRIRVDDAANVEVFIEEARRMKHLSHISAIFIHEQAPYFEISFTRYKPVDCDEKWFMENVFGIGSISEFRKV